jgi:SAM-dependent methyltransferase
MLTLSCITAIPIELPTTCIVLGIDSLEGYVEFAGEQIQDPRVAFRLGDAQALPVESGAYDAVVSGLVLNFLPQPSQALSEIIRAVRIGGTVAAYMWDYAGQKQLMRYFWDAAVALDGAVFNLDEGQRFHLCQPELLRQMFQIAQLGKVEVHLIDVATTFRDFDDYWFPFVGDQGPAPTYTMSLNRYTIINYQKCLISIGLFYCHSYPNRFFEGVLTGG